MIVLEKVSLCPEAQSKCEERRLTGPRSPGPGVLTPADGLTYWCCDGISPHPDHFLWAGQFAVARRRQVQGHGLADEGKVSLLGPADALLHAGHKALLTLHVLVDAAVCGIVGVLEQQTES